MLQLGEYPLPSPPLRGEGEGCSRFCGFRQFKKQIGFPAVDCRPSEKQKAACTTCGIAEPLIPTATPSSLPWERVRERATSRKACIWGCEGVGKDCRNFGRCPLPSPPPRGREQVAADSGVAGRLKKNAGNINGRNFSGSLYRKTDGTNAASVFSDDL